jgi:hypothetical protein
MSRSMRLVALVVTFIAVPALAQEPWRKYNYAPGPNRTQYPRAWRVTPAGETPPQPGAANCGGDVSGEEGEWDGTPGQKGAQMTLSCKAGAFTGVAFASFGTVTGACGSFKKGPCNAANTTAWIKSLCVGKKTCTIPPDPTVRNTHSPLTQALGDPCPGKEKKIAVQLTGCAPAPSPTPVALPIKLSGKGDSVIFDWGQETGGFTTLNFGATSDAKQSISLAYSESSFYWVGGDHSNGGSGPDGTISTGPIAANKAYSPSAAHMRGGFRFLNLVMETDGTVEVMMPSVQVSKRRCFFRVSLTALPAISTTTTPSFRLISLLPLRMGECSFLRRQI